jgi:hypothetical protein
MIVSLEAIFLDLRDDQPEPRRRETAGRGEPVVADGAKEDRQNEELLKDRQPSMKTSLRPTMSANDPAAKTKPASVSA